MKKMKIAALAIAVGFAGLVGQSAEARMQAKTSCTNIDGWGSVIYQMECANTTYIYSRFGVRESCSAWVTTDTWYSQGSSCPSTLVQ